MNQHTARVRVVDLEFQFLQLIFEKAKKQGNTGLAVGLSLFLAFLLTGPAAAQVAPEDWPGVTVDQNQAQPNFPEGITFQFKARAARGGPVFKRAELAYRLDGEVDTNVLQQDLDGTGSLETEIKIDTSEDYIPPGARLSYYWLLEDKTGEVFETPRQELTYQDTRFNFKELKSGLLTVRWSAGDDNFGQLVLAKAQATIERLEKLYNIQPNRPINVTIYPDMRSMFTALPLNTQNWVGGQAVPELGTIVLTLKPGDTAELGRSVPHEITHQVIYQATRNPYNVPPKWLDEGLAVSSQEQIDAFLQQAYQRARQNHTLFPLETLNSTFPADGQRSFVAYGQSLALVQYISQKYSNQGLARILAAFKAGVSFSEAVEQGLGIDLGQLDREWKQSIGYPLNLSTGENVEKPNTRSN